MKNPTATILGGLAAGLAGAALMYIFDPDSGKGRRAKAREQMTDANRKTREAIAGKARELHDRAQDLATRLSPDEQPAAAPPVEM